MCFKSRAQSQPIPNPSHTSQTSFDSSILALPSVTHRKVRKHKQAVSPLAKMMAALKPYDYDEDCSDSSYELVDADEDTYQKNILYEILGLDHIKQEELERLNTVQIKDPKTYIEDEDGAISAASLYQLILNLTNPQAEAEFTRQFLLTFPSFTSAAYVLSTMITRYYCNLRVEYCNIPGDSALKQIRERITRVLSSWIKFAPYQFDQQMFACIDQFGSFNGEGTSGLVINAAIADLRLYFEKPKSKARRKTVTSVQYTQTYIPDGLPATWKLESFLPDELARQLALFHSDTFLALTPKELLGTAWGENLDVENLKAMTKQFDNLSSYVILSIFNTGGIDQRAKRYIWWLDIANESRQYHNYLATFSIVCGLTHHAVQRLRETISKLKREYPKKWPIFEELKTFCDFASNYASYREEIKKISGQCVPFIGCLQKDLIYIQESYPNYVDNLVNFKKCIACADVMKKIEQYQCMSYSFAKIDRAQTLISQIRDAMPSSDLMKLSMAIEKKTKSGTLRVTRKAQTAAVLDF